LEGIVKALLATTLLLGLSSFTAAHAEWEILDPGTAVASNLTAPAPAPTVAAPTVERVAGVTAK
jgi:hypothetical protein